MKRLITFLSLLIIAQWTFGQTLSGTRTVATSPGYATIKAAIDSLNAYPLSGSGIIIYVPAEYTETITAPLSLTATGTSTSNAIVFQKSGSGNNPKITAYTTGTATPSSAVQDGIWNLVGSDYVTIDGFDLYDPNTTNNATMEYGFAMFKVLGTLDGCQYNTIKNCTVTMNKINNAGGSSVSVEGSKAINVVNAIITAQTTALTGLTTAAQTNSYNKFYSNTLQNCNYGIVLYGFVATTPFTAGDLGNDVGGSSAATGNTIINFGGGGTSSPAAAVRANNEWGVNISYNTINNNNGSGVNHGTTLRGIYGQAGTSANATINNNTITLQGGATASQVAAIENVIGSTAASNTVSISNNMIQNCAYTTGTTGTFYAILNSATAATVNINGNTVQNCSYTGAITTGTFLGISNSATGIVTINNNTFNNITIGGTGTCYSISVGSPIGVGCSANGNIITNITRTGASGTQRGIAMNSPTNNMTFNNNLIDGINWTNTASTGSTDGIYSLSSATNITINSNTIRNLSTPSTGTINGIREWGSSGTKIIQNNQVYNFSTYSGGAGGAIFNGIFCSVGNIDISGNSVYNLNSTGSTGGTAGSVYGVNIGGGTTNLIYKNNIFNLSTNSTNPAVAGILIGSGTTNSIFNNFISDLRTPFANAGNPLIGISVTGGTTDNLYYNTVYLNGTSSGALFGSSGISASTTPTLDLRNNLVVNNSIPNGATGYTVAYRRSSTTLTTYAATSNNNDFYAGAPGPNNLIFYDGTNSDLTLAAFQTRVTPRDAVSVSENPPFVNVATTPYNLHIQTTLATQCESAAANVTGITDDYDGNVRQGNAGYSGTGTAPDIGADEFNGMPSVQCSGTPASSNITGPDAVCYNTGTTLGLSYIYTDLGLSYQWAYSTTSGGSYTNTGSNSATLNTGSLTVPTYYICTITCTNSSLFFTTNEKAVTINALPDVQVSPTSGTYCIAGGTGVTLTASNASTYTWSPTTGLTPTTGPIVVATPAVTTTYTVTGTDANGCTKTATATVTAANYPVINSVTANPDAVCPGGTSQLNVIATVPALANSYNFSASSGSFTPISGGTVVTSVQADDAISTAIPIGFSFNYSGNTYSNAYVSSNGFISFNSAATSSATNNLSAPASTILPLIAPLWDDLKGNTTYGSVASYLTTGTAGNRIFTFEWLNWLWNYTATSAVISFQVKLYESDYHTEFIYRQEAGAVVPGTTLGASIGIAGTTVGNFLSLDGTGTSPLASASAETITLLTKPATGQVYTFTLPAPSYSWSPAAGLTPSANVANPVTPPLTSTTPYTVTVSNGSCSVQGTVTVNLAATLNASVTSPTRCTADVTTAITGSKTGGSPPFTYTWSPVYDLYVDAAGTENYDGSASDSPVIYTKAYTVTYNYNLTVTDNCGSTANAVSTVTVQQTPTASVESINPVCSGQTITFNGTTNIGTSFSWTGPNNFTSNLEDPVIPNATTAASGTYYFTATANGCPSATASVSVVVNQSPAPISITPASPLVCPGSVQQLTVTGGTPSPNILNENFNNNAPGWTIISATSSPTLCNWYYQTTPYTDQAGSAKFTNFTTLEGGKFAYSNADAGSSGVTSDSKLISPVFSTTGYSAATLTFEHTYRSYSLDVTVQLEISTDGGINWVMLKNYKGTSIGNINNNSQTTVPENISLTSSYLNQGNLRLRFNYVSAWGYYWIVDNIQITGTPIPLAVTWSPFDDLYKDAGATLAYTGEDMTTVWSKVSTVRTYTVNATNPAECTSTATVTVTAVDYTISGTLKYNNTPKTAMNLVTLTLDPGGKTAVTDGSGNYSFFDVCAGNYTISVTDINKPVGGINSTDAVQMNKWNANQVAIQHVKFLAGEVDYDENVSINATDALAIQNYFVFGTPFERKVITNSPWVFWRAGDVILNNIDPNRLLENFTVTVTGDITVDIYGQAIGDFSGSFTPGNTKGASTSVELVDRETRIAGAGAQLDLPVRMMNSSSVSAVSLVLNFPSDLMQVTGVSMNNSEVQPAWSVKGNELRIGWNSLQTLWLGSNEEMLTISIMTSETFGKGNSIRFSLASDPLNELADGNFEVIPDAVIGIDAVEFSANGIVDPSDGKSVSLQSRPNPFGDYTILSYNLPADGKVTLQVTDLLGRKVSLLVDEYKTSGNYTYKLDAAALQPGVYTATITLDNGNGDIMQTIKLIRK
jgi:hypothetical protein